MNQTEYLEFINEVQNLLVDFVNDYYVPAVHNEKRKESDDIQWTMNLGHTFGMVNILLESWEHAKMGDKVNVCSIPMRFHTYRDSQKLFSVASGSVKSSDGVFILRTRSNAVESLLNDFKAVLETWAMTAEKKVAKKQEFCLN